MPLTIKETYVKTILTKSRLPAVEYVINPYTGCTHACVYCYAVFMKRFTNHKERWGEFLDVKINAPEILEKELKKADKAHVLLSSVTDAYNPAEARYKLTRRILKILLKHQFSVSVLTKSDLVIRDIDILKQFKDVDVGFSFMCFDDKHCRDFEPVASSPERRLAAMKKLKKNGIKIYAFIGPIMPQITKLDEMFIEFKKIGINFIYCENLNHKAGTWDGIFNIIKRRYPELAEDYNRIFFTENNYWNKIKEQIKKLSKETRIHTELFFH